MKNSMVGDGRWGMFCTVEKNADACIYGIGVFSLKAGRVFIRI